MGRAGRRTMREIREQRLQVARKHWRRYLVLALMLTGGAAVSMIWMHPLMRAYTAGVYSMLFVALVAYSLMVDGSHLRMMGAEAERWTSTELRKAKGWRVVDAVEFHDRDVDHVAVGPEHVLAVETKWTTREVRIDEHGVHGLWCDGIEAAQRAAKRTKHLLASKGVHQPVIPVLVLWGPGVPRIPGGYQRIHDVRVVVGAQGDEWRSRLARLPQWSRSTTGVSELIEDYVRTFDARNKTPLRKRLLDTHGMSG